MEIQVEPTATPQQLGFVASAIAENAVQTSRKTVGQAVADSTGHFKMDVTLPKPGEYEAVFNSDEVRYGGKGTELPVVTAEKEPLHGLPFSGSFTLAPLSVAFYRKKTAPRKKTAKS